MQRQRTVDCVRPNAETEVGSKETGESPKKRGERAFVEKVTVPQMAKKLLESQGSIPRLQETATGLCPEPDKSNPHPHFISLRQVLISSLALGPIQPPVQWVPGVLSSGVKRGRGVMLTTHPYLVPRSWMSRSYTSSPPQAPPWRVEGLLYFYFTLLIWQVFYIKLHNFFLNITTNWGFRFSQQRAWRWGPSGI
jgi:hypothetical protein